MNIKLKLTLLMLIPLSLSAQINKRQWLVGGNIVAQYQENSQSKDVAKELRTPIGGAYFVIDKLALGIKGQFYYKSAIQNYNTMDVLGNVVIYSIKEDTKEYAAGPFLRYYLLPKSGFFNLYLEGYYSYGVLQYVKYGNTIDPERILKTSTFNVNIAPVLMFNQHVSLELIIAYYLQKPEGIPTEVYTLLMGAGLQVHLGGGKKTTNN